MGGEIHYWIAAAAAAQMMKANDVINLAPLLAITMRGEGPFGPSYYSTYVIVVVVAVFYPLGTCTKAIGLLIHVRVDIYAY